MARKHHKSKSRAFVAKKRASLAATSTAEPSREIVENERARLLKASAILACVARAMEGEGVCAGRTPYWPAAIESANELIEEAVRNLEAGIGVDAVRDVSASYEIGLASLH